MSEIRGKCDFCMNSANPPTYTPCVWCRRDQRRTDWRPSAAGDVALRLEEDIVALRAQLARVREALDVHDGYPVGQLEGVLFKTNAIRAAIDQEAKTDASEDHKPH
jgi:hypothetical protein